jgi:hypothetical protein
MVMSEASLSEKLQKRYDDPIKEKHFYDKVTDLKDVLEDLSPEARQKYEEQISNVFERGDQESDSYFLGEISDQVFKEYRTEQKIKEFKRDISEASGSEEYDKILEKAIGKTKDSKELFRILEITDGIQGSQERFSLNQVKTIFDNVSKGTYGIESITRSAGLRDKIMEIAAQPEGNKRSYFENIQLDGKKAHIEYQYTPIVLNQKEADKGNRMVRVKKDNKWILMTGEEFGKITNIKNLG